MLAIVAEYHNRVHCPFAVHANLNMELSQTLDEVISRHKVQRTQEIQSLMRELQGRKQILSLRDR